METAELMTADYWRGRAPDLRFNPVGSPDQEGLMAFASASPALEGHVLVATSGTRKAPKWIAISKEALLASATAVNSHLEVTTRDRWLLALPDFHVGGLGVFARALLAGTEVSAFGGRWRGRARAFAEHCRSERTSLTALTPTQVHDLVKEAIPAPECLRAVIVGGGSLDEEIGRAARDLGWPVLQSFGMTEAGSQIATESLRALDEPFAGDWLPVLPHWEVKRSREGRLSIGGLALFSGHVEREERGGAWEFHPLAKEGEGFFETADRVDLRSGGAGVTELRFLGRWDDQVKVLGELVSLDVLRRRWERLLNRRDHEGTIVALPDERREHRLIGVIEGVAAGTAIGEELRIAFQSEVAPFERLDRVVGVPELPRTAIGKIALGRLEEAIIRESTAG